MEKDFPIRAVAYVSYVEKYPKVYKTPVLAHMMLPFLVATELSSPPGNNSDLIDVPMFMHTHVEHTIPIKHSTWPKGASSSKMTMSLSTEDTGWDRQYSCFGKPILKEGVDVITKLIKKWYLCELETENPTCPFISIKLRFGPGNRLCFFCFFLTSLDILAPGTFTSMLAVLSPIFAAKREMRAAPQKRSKTIHPFLPSPNETYDSHPHINTKKINSWVWCRGLNQYTFFGSKLRITYYTGDCTHEFVK